MAAPRPASHVLDGRIDFVGDAGRHFANGFHFLQVPQLRLQLRFVRGVAGKKTVSHDGAVGLENGRGETARPIRASILSAHGQSVGPAFTRGQALPDGVIEGVVIVDSAQNFDGCADRVLRRIARQAGEGVVYKSDGAAAIRNGGGKLRLGERHRGQSLLRRYTTSVPRAI